MKGYETDLEVKQANMDLSAENMGCTIDDYKKFSSTMKELLMTKITIGFIGFVFGVLIGVLSLAMSL